MPATDPAARSDADRAVWRLTRAALGREVAERFADSAPDPQLLDRAVDDARAARVLSVLAGELVTGSDVPSAFVAAVRAALADKDTGRGTDRGHLARSLAISPLTDGLPDLRHLGLGLVHTDRRQLDAAWRELSRVDPGLLAQHAPVELVDCALRSGTPEGVEAALAVVADPDRLDSATLVRVAGPFLAFGRRDVATTLVEEVRRRSATGEQVDDDTRAKVTNLERWTHPQPSPARPAGAVPIAVMDYYQPDLDRSSRNVGDYVQTLSMLGHLVRYQGVRFSGDAGLGQVATGLQSRVRPALRVAEPRGDVHLVPVSRDFSEGDDLPDGTWMVAFGWHLHAMWRLRYGFPYHSAINPLFVSFHVNHVDALTPEAVDYLRAHGPIGCRDWTTVDLLLAAGVDAFFTGCVTTTVSTLFPERDEVREADGVVAVIDFPDAKIRANRPVEVATNVDKKYRYLGIAEGLTDAAALLEGYQRRYHRIVTSRLHSYLPATSLGIPVSFRPKRLSDVRFDGLLELSPGSAQFEDIRAGIIDLLGEVMPLVVSGADRDAVYARWREVAGPKVAQARARWSEPARLREAAASAGDADTPAIVARIRERQRHGGPPPGPDATHVALVLDDALAEHVPVTLESLVSNASGPLHLWLCTRGVGADVHDRLTALFPEVPMTFLPFDDVDGAVERLLLPDLLADVDRIVSIAVDTVTEGDVRELAATDLEGAPIAARGSTRSAARLWRDLGDRLPAPQAFELRRTMSATHPFDFPALDAGVLVLDLARMRADLVAQRLLPMVAAYGLSDHDALTAYVGPGYRRLDPAWSALPALDDATGPRIIHFAGAGRPWSPYLAPGRDRWQHYQERLARRAGAGRAHG